ncbi:MAG TPA: competence/damage-inducible protein A [Baekduia sp.]|nr:competence/damage-inducible protein A [Baekduia sp.]
MSARAGIVITGTEVLTGVISDRNGPWLAAQLANLGVDVGHIEVVGDRPDDIARALSWLAEDGCDLIATSGGLGPTEDDLTVSVVADFHGRELVHDPELDERIGKILQSSTRRWLGLDADALARSRRKQAMMPAGATILEPIGTAPGFIVAPAHGPGPDIVVLPGPPRELQPMWERALAAGALDHAIAGRVERERHVVRLFGLPESEIAATLRVARDRGIDIDALEITTCLRRGELEVDTRFVPSRSQIYADLEELIRERHGERVFSLDGATVDDIVAGLLRSQELTVAVAESLTGGLMAARLSNGDGASDFLLGGVVAYTEEAKVAVAGVDEAVIESSGVVSLEVAAALAQGAISTFDADIGIGLTGEAGPKSASGRPVGTVCVSVIARDGREITHEVELSGDRGDIRDRTCATALHALRRVLQQPA